MFNFSISATYTDLYEISMAQAYLTEGRQHEKASFDYFFRKTPFEGGYTVFAGLDDLLNILEDLHFTEDDLYFLKQLKLAPQTLDFFKDFSFNGAVYSVAEGEVVFPQSPILRIEGNIIEAQLVESLVLNFLNFESLIATKAARIRQVAGNRILSDFGMRRAQGPGAILASRAAVVGGFDSTSNVYAAERYGLNTSGTMAHSFVQSCDNELEAFRVFANANNDNCVFLVDTYNTLQSGVPNAILVAKELEEKGKRARGIRLDSGDLAYLSKATREMLNEAGLSYIKIIASNQLDEFVIKSLNEQGAPIDIFGVGTKLITGQPDAALDGVYKLAMSADKPRLKLSETKEKTTLPGIKQVFRIIEDTGFFYGADAIALTSEKHPVSRIFHPYDEEKSLDIQHFHQEPMLEKVMEKGHRSTMAKQLKDIAAYAKQRLTQLPDEYKRFEYPHLYKVGISEELRKLKRELIDAHKFGR